MGSPSCRRALVSCLALLSVAAAGRAHAGSAAGNPPPVLTLGMMAEMPGETVERHIDFVRYVARKLFPGGGAQGAVRIAATPDALVKLVDEGRIHFYMESLYATYVVNERTGARLLLRRWKKGRGEYRSVIFARRDSGLRDLDNLRGKLVVFEDAGSTSGYALPRSLLVRKGFVLDEKPSFDAAVAAGEIGYLFAHGDEENVVNWVLLGRAAAGALSDAGLDALDPRRRAGLVVLAETQAVPRHLVSVSPAVPPIWRRA
ncbi:MAG TPA: PhnD/SsuA/transferrin family substrate-binding protein [Thermodesulfobacteriota bacterium]